MTYRLVLIDDHPVVAVGLRLALHASPFELVATATDPSSGAAAIECHRPDGLLLDLVFDGAINLPLIRFARSVCPAAVVIVFSALHEMLHGRQVLDAGADAFLNKSTDLGTVVARLTDLVTLPRPSPLLVPSQAKLTLREIEIARHISRGSPIGVIAQAMGVSVGTASAHRDNLRRKLNCRDTKDLVARLARMDGVNDVI